MHNRMQIWYKPMKFMVRAIKYDQIVRNHRVSNPVNKLEIIVYRHSSFYSWNERRTIKQNRGRGWVKTDALLKNRNEYENMNATGGN